MFFTRIWLNTNSCFSDLLHWFASHLTKISCTVHFTLHDKHHPPELNNFIDTVQSPFLLSHFYFHLHSNNFTHNTCLSSNDNYGALFTHESRGSTAFICVWVSVCVCPHDRIKTAESTIVHQTCHRDSPSWVLATHLILGRKVKGQGHRVTKCKNALKAIEWPVWVCTSIECPFIVQFKVM